MEPTDHTIDCYFCLSTIKRGKTQNEYFCPKKQRLSESPEKTRSNEQLDFSSNLAGPSSRIVYPNKINEVSRKSSVLSSDEYDTDKNNDTSQNKIHSSDEEILQVIASQDQCDTDKKDSSSENVIFSSDEEILQITALSNNGDQCTTKDDSREEKLDECLSKNENDYKCKQSPDNFCYICGCTVKKSDKKICLMDSDKLRLAYNAYFGKDYMHQDQNWVPHYSCNSCASVLYAWYRGEERYFKFSVPRLWSKPSNHTTDCFFCMMNDESWNKTELKILKTSELNIPSSLAPITTDESHPRPDRRQQESKSSASIGTISDPSISGSEYTPSNTKITKSPKILDIDEVEDLIRALGLPKSKGELLLSRLKEWGYTGPEVKITSQRTRQKPFSSFYTSQHGICYCEDIKGMLDINENFNIFTLSWSLFCRFI